mgnify:CR=1 FL=1
MKGVQCLTTETERTLDQSKKMYKALIVLGIVIVAFNLRPGMTSVGPLIGTIRDDVGLANWGAGLLTSLPLIAFAIVSPIVPRMIVDHRDRYFNPFPRHCASVVLRHGFSWLRDCGL